MNDYKDLLGLCIINRTTGEHESHFFFLPEELEMPGYVEAIEKTYEGTRWMSARFYCAKVYPMQAKDERPHSRACGVRIHDHGLECARDCPTCTTQVYF